MASKSYTLLEYLVTIEMELKKLKKIVAESVGADYSELIANIDGIRNELNTFKTSITDTVNTNNSEITSKFNSLEQQFNTFKTSITNTVNSNKSEITSQVNTLTTDFNSFKTSLESQVNGLNTRVTSVERRVTTLENSGGSIGGSGEADGYGEKLIAHYIHQGNPEFQFTSFNFTTCEGTTSKAHGLSSAIEVMVVPNEWSLSSRNNNILAIPTEWVTYSGKIKLVPVDDVTLRVTKNDGTSLLTVNTSDSNNVGVDCTKFHFEQPLAWSISNIPIASNYVRIIIKGYVKPYTSRYLSWKTKDNSANEEFYQIYLKFSENPTPAVAQPYPRNCIYGEQNIVLDFRDGVVDARYSNYYEGRRCNFANMVWDLAKEENIFVNGKIGTDNAGLSYIGNYNSTYAYNSNGTHVYIYDLGGTL